MTTTIYRHDYGDGEAPSDFGTRYRFSFSMAADAAQRLADANGAPVGIWERGGIYAISEDPPETICPDPSTDGWELAAVVDHLDETPIPAPCARLALPDGYNGAVALLVGVAESVAKEVKLRMETSSGLVGVRWARLDDTCVACGASVASHLADAKERS